MYIFYEFHMEYCKADLKDVQESNRYQVNRK